jgi:hypothetical protein
MRYLMNLVFICILLGLSFSLSFAVPQQHGREPFSADYDVALVTDLNDSASSLPNYWKPCNKIVKGHIRSPFFLPPRQELDQFISDINGKAGNASFFLPLDDLYQGFLSIAPRSRWIQAVREWKDMGGKVFIMIREVPEPLWADTSGQVCSQRDCGGDSWSRDPDCRLYRPRDFAAYQALLEDLIKYLTLPPELGVMIQDSILGLDQPASTQGFDDVYFVFWEEANASRHKDDWCRAAWTDDYAQWLKLYDYWVAAVRTVRSEYPDDVHFKIGTKWLTGNQLDQVGKALYDADTFIEFLNGNPPPISCFDSTYDQGDDSLYSYEYRSDPPLDLDFMTRQRRTDDHQLLSKDGIQWFDTESDSFEYCGANAHLAPHDETSGFDSNFYLKFEQNGFPDMEWYSWDIKNDVAGEIQDFILSATSPYQEGRQRYCGVQSDNQMGAVNYLAQVWDHFENPDQRTFTDPEDTTATNDMLGLWAEFWADPRGYPGTGGSYPTRWPNHDNDSLFTSYDYGFYKGGEGMLFTNSGGWNMYEDQSEYPVSIKKPFYNIVEMIGNLQSREVPVSYSFGTGFQNDLDKGDMIRGIVTRSAAGDTIAVLWWYYMNPQDIADAIDSLDYQAIMDHVEMSDMRDVVIKLKNVPMENYEMHRYVVDDVTSNGWTYRDCIYCFYESGDSCNANDPAVVTDPGVAEDRVIAINGWKKWLGNGNPCNASVALEEVETDLVSRNTDGSLVLNYQNVKPWTAMLIMLQTGLDSEPGHTSPPGLD